MQIRESSDVLLFADQTRALTELQFVLVSRNPLALLSTESRLKSPRNCGDSQQASRGYFPKTSSVVTQIPQLQRLLCKMTFSPSLKFGSLHVALTDPFGVQSPAVHPTKFFRLLSRCDSPPTSSSIMTTSCSTINTTKFVTISAKSLTICKP